MGKNKHYPTIHSRDVQRNFNVLKDALAEHGTVYISHYNKPFAKVIAEPINVSEEDNDIDKLLDEVGGCCAERGKEIANKSYDEVYREELMKRYG